MDCNTCKSELCDMRGIMDMKCYGYQPKTNADRIRAMSDEELANVIALLIEKNECFRDDFGGCEKCPLDAFCSDCRPGNELEWLKQPAE